METEIKTTDNFDESDGTFRGYDVYDQAQKSALASQRHTDIRSFPTKPLTTRVRMIHLDLFPLELLDGIPLIDLEGEVIVQKDEQWTNGAASVDDPSRHNWPTLIVQCSPGVNATSSVIRP